VAEHQSSHQRQHGAIAVVCRKQRLLVIRRSKFVVAPRTYCFPGGAIELGESESQALQREFHEELGARLQPVRRIWQSLTPWHVRLSWWLADLEPDAVLCPNLQEVESIHWLTTEEIRALPELLTSNHAFLAAWDRREFSLPMEDG
jgi:8-oxo-dGTP diphosphatase